MRLKNLDLLLTIFIAVCNGCSALLPGLPVCIKILLALPMVFVLPGYILSNIFFQKRTFDIYQRLLSTLSLSLAVVILSGFLLNLLPGGLQTLSWTIFLAAFVIAGSLVVMLLRHTLPRKFFPALRFRLTLFQAFLLLGTLLLSATSLAYTKNGIAQQPHALYTQLWMLPSQESDKQWLIQMGLQNEEGATSHYQLTLSVNGTITRTWPAIALSPHQVWQLQMPLQLKTPENTYVELRLYRLQQARNVYREVHATLKTTVSSNKKKF